VIDLDFGATADGQLNIATFVWTVAPCPAAVKIKFFRPDGPTVRYRDERGPFDVVLSAQTVSLSPPVSINRGDLIGITSLTSCGAPTIHNGNRGSGYFVAGGDLKQDVTPPAFLPPPTGQVNVLASNAPALSLLNGRFAVTLVATNPRTARQTTGTSILGSDRFGSFSLPEFTGDPTFPEVIVKMADATALAPPLGGSFWFFYSSLTDVQYTLTVTDQVSGKTRTYSNTPGGPGQLCGGADTSAFPGP
jgi:hypothetical protein